MSDKISKKEEQVADKSKAKELSDEELKKAAGGRIVLTPTTPVTIGPDIPTK